MILTTHAPFRLPRRWMRLIAVFLLSSGLALVAAPTVGDAADVAIAAGKPNEANKFKPRKKTVRVGDKVTWTVVDDDCHTVTSGKDGIPDGKFGSELLCFGETPSSFELTVDEVGKYFYYCDPHFESMKGKLVVKPPKQT